MRKIVLDTNVIVSAILSPQGTCSEIMDLVFNNELQAYYCDAILAEYKDVLSRASLDLNRKMRAMFFEIIREAGTVITSPTSDIVFPHESDRIFYDTARESGAVLITGNIKHFPAEDFIMTPSQFLEGFFSAS